MKKLIILNLVLLFSVHCFSFFKAYFPKNVKAGDQIINYSDTLLETQTISLDTNGYILLVNSNGMIVELDSVGDYFLDNVLTNFKSDYQPSRELTNELITFLDQTPDNIDYKRLGSVSCIGLHDADVSLLCPRESIWLKGIPLSIYASRKDSGISLTVIVENLFSEHLHTQQTTEPNEISFSSDSLFDAFYNSIESDGGLSTVFFDTDPSLNNFEGVKREPRYSINLKKNEALKVSYLKIAETNQSEFVKSLLKTAFFRKNKMDIYRLSSLVDLHDFTRAYPVLKPILHLESGIHSRHIERVFGMIVNKQD